MGEIDDIFEFRLAPSEAESFAALYTSLCSRIGEKLDIFGGDVGIDTIAVSNIFPCTYLVHWSTEDGREGCALALIEYTQPWAA